MIQVIENFLPPSLSAKLLDNVEDNNFPWYYLKNSISTHNISYAKYPQLVHSLYYNNSGPISPFFNTFNNILYFIEDKFSVKILDISRIKINCVLRTDNPILHIPHVDISLPGYTTFIYYLNTSDGYTNIYSETECKDFPYYETDSHLTLVKQVQPVQNSILRFDSNQYHSYLTPIHCDRRFVVNMVLKLQ